MLYITWSAVSHSMNLHNCVQRLLSYLGLAMVSVCVCVCVFVLNIVIVWNRNQWIQRHTQNTAIESNSPVK